MLPSEGEKKLGWPGAVPRAVVFSEVSTRARLHPGKGCRSVRGSSVHPCLATTVKAVGSAGSSQHFVFYLNPDVCSSKLEALSVFVLRW